MKKGQLVKLDIETGKETEYYGTFMEPPTEGKRFVIFTSVDPLDQDLPFEGLRTGIVRTAFYNQGKQKFTFSTGTETFKLKIEGNPFT
jgi:hypothetical protein